MNDIRLNTAEEPSTACLLWLGPFQGDGYPIYVKGLKQVMVGRRNWQAVYGVQLPKTAFLRRVCPMTTCVAPWHFILKSPQSVSKALGARQWHMRRLRGLLRRRAALGVSSGIWWDAREPRKMQFVPEVAHEVAMDMDAHVLVVLSAYAGMVIKSLEV